MTQPATAPWSSPAAARPDLPARRRTTATTARRPDDFTYTLGPAARPRPCRSRSPASTTRRSAVDDTATVAEDAAATAIDVLANDTDVDGGPKSRSTSVTQPANGTVVITGGGDRPDLRAGRRTTATTGRPTDTFTYTLNGGSTATVTVTVTCVDDPPVAVDDAATVARGRRRDRDRRAGQRHRPRRRPASDRRRSPSRPTAPS